MKGNWKKVCIFSQMSGSIAHHIGNMLLPKFKESSKNYEPTRLNDPRTIVTSRATAIGNCDGDFRCWWLTPDVCLLAVSRPKSFLLGFLLAPSAVPFDAESSPSSLLNPAGVPNAPDRW
jgi:hypothetical protein